MVGYKYGENGFDVGVYFTDAKYRGLGLGTKTWNAALEGLGPNCNISLNANHGMPSLYAKLGFDISGPKRKIFVGVPNRMALYGSLPANVVIEKLEKGCVDELRKYDREVSGVDRFAIVRRYLTTCVGTTFVARKGVQIVGFAALDKRSLYHSFSPLYADNMDVAVALTRRLLELVPEKKPVAMDVFSENLNAHVLRKDIGINEVLQEEMTLMFTREKYDYQIDKVYSDIADCFPLV